MQSNHIYFRALQPRDVHLGSCRNNTHSVKHDLIKIILVFQAPVHWEAYFIFQINIYQISRWRISKSVPTPGIQRFLAICYGSHLWFGKGKESHVCSQLLKVQVFKGIQQDFGINITQNLINCAKYKTDKPQIAKLTKNVGLKTTSIYFFFSVELFGLQQELISW